MCHKDMGRKTAVIVFLLVVAESCVIASGETGYNQSCQVLSLIYQTSSKILTSGKPQK